MSKDTVSAEQFYNEHSEWQLSNRQVGDSREEMLAKYIHFADALSQHNTEALEARIKEVLPEGYRHSDNLVDTIKTLANNFAARGRRCEEFLDRTHQAEQRIEDLQAELSALRGKETEPATSACPCLLVGKDGSHEHNEIVATFRHYGGATFQSCANHLEGYGDGIDGWKRIPVSQTAAPRKHTTWTEVKAEMDAPPVALPTEEEERKELQARITELEAVIERDRTDVCDGVNVLKKVVQQREWLGEGRGPYEWDDDRWHAEFKATAAEIRGALSGLEKIAADLSNSPKTHEAVLLARARRPLSMTTEKTSISAAEGPIPSGQSSETGV